MSNRTCTIPECGKQYLARGYCQMHYRRLMKYGSPHLFQKCHGTIEERFWSKVDKRGPSECWPWTSNKSDSGYGRITIHNEDRLAHRVSYELNVGPIPEGLDIDHVSARGCTRKDCVNPGHLEAVTSRENTLRAESPPALNVLKSHCKHGHEFTPDNIYVGPKGGRRCRTCRAEQKAERSARAAT